MKASNLVINSDMDVQRVAAPTARQSPSTFGEVEAHGNDDRESIGSAELERSTPERLLHTPTEELGTVPEEDLDEALALLEDTFGISQQQVNQVIEQLDLNASSAQETSLQVVHSALADSNYCLHICDRKLHLFVNSRV